MSQGRKPHFWDKFTFLENVGDSTFLQLDVKRQQVASALHSYGKNKKQNPKGKKFSYRPVNGGFLITLVEIKGA